MFNANKSNNILSELAKNIKIYVEDLCIVTHLFILDKLGNELILGRLFEQAAKIEKQNLNDRTCKITLSYVDRHCQKTFFAFLEIEHASKHLAQIKAA